MKILEPAVELITNNNNIEHIANCSRICYKSNKTEGHEQLYKALINNGHLSTLRHGTSYYRVYKNKHLMSILDGIYYTQHSYGDEKETVICGIDVEKCLNLGVYLVVCNWQYLEEHKYTADLLAPFKCDIETFIKDNKVGRFMLRYTFKLTTQISTSRELNRVSPNNILEQSTRYVYEEGSIVRPHWISREEVDAWERDIDSHSSNHAHFYLDGILEQFVIYDYLVSQGVDKQDARGILPLDTTTRVAYTYSVKEWNNIIQLRYYGVTGKPHENAKIIIGMVKSKLEELGYFN